MKILFVENRYRTFFLAEMAALLQKDGHQIFFIVENKKFFPNIICDDVFVIPYFKYNCCAEDSQGELFEYIKCSDRAVRHFSLTNTSHYNYYYNKTRDYLKRIKPDVVFGESTAFHELLTIAICKNLDIPYLQPSTCRYPVGRFSFYKYDTLEPFGGCCEFLSNENASAVIEEIANRSIVPDYMRRPRVDMRTRLGRLRELCDLASSYYAGERYNTPSPFCKLRLEKTRKHNIDSWEKIMRNRPDKSADCFKILYPLQMQPEANLDVWGRKYNDQVALLREILNITDTSVKIIVKPNPKSKYEMSERLLSLVENESRIIPIGHSVPMGKVMPVADMVLTVTGTIAIECSLTNKPVVTLVDTINNRSRNCLFLESIAQLPQVIEQVQNGHYPKNTPQENIDVINRLYSTSYEGLPYERFLLHDNIVLCKKAFDDLLEKIECHAN